MLKSLIMIVGLCAMVPTAHAVTTADQLTCAQLKQEVQETGRFYKHVRSSGSSPIPIYDFKKLDAGGRSGHCGGRRVSPWYLSTKTLDNDSCVYGWNCL